MNKPIHETVNVPEGYFIFSNPQRESKSLDNWRQWLDRQGIKHITAQQEDGRHVLLRKGTEAGAGTC